MCGATRKPLPTNRQALIHAFIIGGHEGILIVGMHEDGSVGEIFVQMDRMGSVVQGLLDSFAIMFSLAIQFGVPLERLVEHLKDMRFEPSGFTDNEDIKTTKSISDYIARFLESRFLGHKPA